jgi:hypothetical protein
MLKNDLEIMKKQYIEFYNIQKIKNELNIDLEKIRL